MKAILSSIAVAAALVGGAARALDADAANPPAVDPAAMKAALERALAKGEISPGEAAEMAKMPDLLMAERKAAEIRDRLRAIEDETQSKPPVYEKPVSSFRVIIVVHATSSDWSDTFAVNPGYPSFEMCEAARADLVEGFLQFLERRHLEPFNADSKCARSNDDV